MRNAVTRDILAQVLGKVACSLLGLLVVTQLCRFLSVAEFGAYTLAFSLVAFFQPVVDMGTNAIAVREVTRRPESAGPLLTGIMLVKLGLAVISVLLLALAAVLLGYPADVRLLASIAGISLFGAVLGTLEVMLIVRQQLYLAVGAQILANLLLVGAVFGLIRSGAPLSMLLGAQVGCLLVASLLVYSQGRRGVRFCRPDFPGLRSFLAACLPQGLASLITACYYNIDALLLAKLLDTQAVGYYGAAYRILGLLVFVPHAVMMSIYPLLVKARTEGQEEFTRLFRRSFVLLMVVGCAAALWGTFYAGPLITLIYSPTYQPAVKALQVLMWAGVGVFASHLAGYTLVVLDRQQVGIYISSAALIVNILLNLWLIPGYGIDGAAGATLLTEFFVAVCGFVCVFRVGRLTPLSRQMGWIPAAALAVLTLALLCHAVHWLLASTVIFGTLALLVAAFVASWERGGIPAAVGEEGAVR